MDTAYRLEKETIFKPTINRGSTITGRFGAISLFSLAAMSVASCGGGDGGGSAPPPSDQMRIEPPQPHPDLIIEATAVSNDALTPGQQFTLSVTVRNLGSSRAPATTLRYKSHAQIPIVTSDPTVGTDSVPSLGPSDTSSESIDLTAPSDAGTYYYGACVDAVSGESDTDNNCSGNEGVMVTVSAAPTTRLPGGPTNRTHPPLRQCNDFVLINQAGGVVLPSIDTVQIPAGQGTLRMEWDALSIPDRFVLEVDGQVVIDTQYVGSPSYTISDINQSLSANGLPLVTQTSVISPGSGMRDVLKTSSATSAVLKVYAPLPSTQWSVTLTWICGSGGPSTGPGQPSVLAFSVEDGCDDGRDIQYRFFEQKNGSLTGNRWPEGGRVYVTPRLGESVTTRLSCDAGTYVCLGAESRGDESGSWGAGIDGNQGCTDCCHSCPVSGERSEGVSLTCPSDESGRVGRAPQTIYGLSSSGLSCGSYRFISERAIEEVRIAIAAMGGLEVSSCDMSGLSCSGPITFAGETGTVTSHQVPGRSDSSFRANCASNGLVID